MEQEPAFLRLKLSPALKEWLRAEARRNCRSMNGQVDLMLEFARREMNEKKAAVPATN